MFENNRRYTDVTVSKMTNIVLHFKKVLKMENVFVLAPLVILHIFSAFISECSCVADQGGYFLFTPPFGGDRPAHEVAASKRSGALGDNDGGPTARAGISPAESLWVGSHKINWSPLPIFQKFIDHHQQKQKQRLAQARKYDLDDYQQQRFAKTRQHNDPGDQKQKIQMGPFALDAPPYKIGQRHKKPIFHNPHHDFSNKFSTGGFFAGLSAAFGKSKNAPKVVPPKFAESRSSVQPERDYGIPPSALPQSQRNQPTTPIPSIQSSTRGTILVTPPGTVRALSTPGPSLDPIIDRLRKMTEWSKQSQKSSLIKKEGKPNSSLERKLGSKKRSRADTKPHKPNIEAIILSNDDDDDFNYSLSTERHNQHIPIKNKSLSKAKRKSRGRNVSKERNNNNDSGSSEESVINTRAIQMPETDIVVLHPTNAAYLQDPLDVQQSALKSYRLSRKDKKIEFFQSEGIVNKPEPLSFRFGAEDAKPNPYINN